MKGCRMKKVFIISSFVFYALFVFAGYKINLLTSNGTTPVTVVEAPAAGTNRVVVGLTVYNSGTTQVTFTVSTADTITTNPLYTVDIKPGGTNTWNLPTVEYLPDTTNTLELVGATGFGSILKVTPKYRDVRK